jgi:hypothetical protein
LLQNQHHPRHAHSQLGTLEVLKYQQVRIVALVYDM